MFDQYTTLKVLPSLPERDVLDNTVQQNICSTHSARLLSRISGAGSRRAGTGGPVCM